ncbi:Ger(x)C family spore germination protein [Clostridium intestinale]|uniref:Germination protein, Ger(X)C family n=1 Tax=Clostridium intestinale URNW TaxID=1294142 RepID=U2NMG7_9CLOT|nr:Ger(x)C family spore germination protein [Clostridium intestinale]ERK30031.1 germination protein, Ger(X)C family [Clostridium intestinale URNW]
MVMKINKKIYILLLFIFISTNLSSCWNYREINDMSIVSGVAIDKGGTDGKYEVTVELIDIQQGKDVNMHSKYITLSGNTMFEISRNMIALIGKKLYWSHSKSIIISEDIARDGISGILDWYSRDAETRTDARILVSKENTAKEVLKSKPVTENYTSFELSKLLKNEDTLSNIPVVDLWDILDTLAQDGLSTWLPTVKINKNNDDNILQVDGSAIFSKDKLIGCIDENSTKNILFAKDKVNGGLLVLDKESESTITFEIFKNKTTIKPSIENGNLQFNIYTDTTVSLDEIQSDYEFYTEEGKNELENELSDMLQKSIYSSIKRIQSEYGADILGFGAKLNEDNPATWNDVKDDWDKIFKTLTISVNSKVNIKNSAVTSKPIKVGD